MADIRQFPRRKRQPFQPINPGKWEGTEPEPVSWLVQGCVPRGAVCLFSGDSGLGKSLLMQGLQTCAALGRPWLGLHVERVRSFGLYCEDPENILQRRQRDMCRHLGVTESDLEEQMSLISRVGMDNVLMDFNRRTDEGQVTELYAQVQEWIGGFGAELVIIDTLAHTFAGNENIRNHVTAFVGALQGLCRETGGSVILCSHPSVTSLLSGTGYSGSTAWRASVRAHMYLKRPKGYDDEADDADHGERILKTMKANWGPGAGVIRLRWQDGVFVADQQTEEQPVVGVIGKLTIEMAVMRGVAYIMDDGDRIAAGRQSNNNIAKVLKTRLKSCAKYTVPDIFAAADRLLEDGKLVRVRAGRAAKPATLLRTNDRRYSDEIGGPVDDGEAEE